MSNTLEIVQVGVVGVTPRILFLQTAAIESDVVAPGFINEIEAVTGTTVNPGDFIMAVYDHATKSEIFIPLFGPGRIITLQGIAGSGNAPGGVTGATNLGAGLGWYAGLSGANLTFKSIIAGAGISLSSSSTGITVTATGGGGGGGGSFQYLDTFWVAKNGNDANDGKSIDAPKLTIAGAIAAFATATTPSIINIVDNGVYDETVAIDSNADVIINGPGASVVGIFLFPNARLNACLKETTDTEGFSIGVQSGATLNMDIDSVANGMNCSGGTIRGYARLIDGDITYGDGGRCELFFDSITGGFTGVNCFVKLIGNSMSGSISVTGGTSNSSGLNGFIASTGFGFTVTTSGSNNTILSGIFGTQIFNLNFMTQCDMNNTYFTREVVKQVRLSGGTYTLTEDDSNVMFLYDDPSNGLVIMPTYFTNPNFPIGFRAWVCQASDGGSVEMLSGDPVLSRGNDTWVNGKGGVAQITLLNNNGSQYTWGLSGNLTGSAATSSTVNVYVSQLFGNDTTGIGSASLPYATIGAAITALGTPTNNSNVVILDDAVYDENVVVAHPKINIMANEATLNATSGASLTINSSGASHVFTFNTIGASAGSAIVNSNDSDVTVNANYFTTGAASTNNGTLILRGGSMINARTVTGSGAIYYVAGQDTGTLTPGSGTISGISSTRFGSGFVLPVTDGTSGQAIVTDGSKILSFATVSGGGGLTFSNVSGTTQAAAVNHAYVCQNAAQTTVTLPATAALGDTVRVYGQGAAGWILAANTGQTINLGTSTTISGGSLTSAAATDLVEVTCLVANTTWQVNFVNSTGLIIA